MRINSTIYGNLKLSYEAYERNPLKGNFDGKEVNVKIVSKYNDNDYLVEQDGKKYTVKLLKIDTDLKQLTFKINGDILEITQEDEYDMLLKSLGMGAGAVKKVNDMKAPMPGVVIDVKISVGQEVKKDDGLVVLEAMKMENLLKSPIDGIIKSIEIAKGDTVEKNKVLVNFE